MKKILLPLIASSILFSSNIDDSLDKVMINLNNKNYDEAILQLKQLPPSEQIDFLLGKAYFEKHLTYTDYKFALSYFQKVNTPKAYYYLATMYRYGLGVDPNMSEAIRYYKLSNTKESKYQLAKIYLEGDYLLKKPKTGLKLLEQSAKMGYNDAQFELGKLYLNDNEVVEQDLYKASKWIYLSAHKHNFQKAKELWNKYRLYKYQENE